MSKLFIKHLALALLVIFMTNIAVWSVHSNWLAHELEHVSSLTPMTVADDHDAGYDGNTAVDNVENTPNTIEHQLLHAADHLQLFPSPTASGIFLSLLSVERSYFTPIIVAIATFEAPFRPPRITSFLA